MRRGPYLDRDRPVRQRSERTLRVWGYIVPTFSVVLFAMVITLPWGFGKGMLYVPPLLIMALIFAWTVRQPTLMPSVLVFSVGIGVDVITASPIGYWAFLYLVSYAGALHLVRWEFGWPTWTIVWGFVLVSTLVAVMAWSLSSIYFGQMMDWRPAFESVKLVWFVCPVIAIMTRWLDRQMRLPKTSNVSAQVPA